MSAVNDICCTDIIEAKKDIESLEDQLEALAETLDGEREALTTRMDHIDGKLDEIQRILANRVPTWATLLMTGMGTIIGILLGAIAAQALR